MKARLIAIALLTLFTISTATPAVTWIFTPRLLVLLQVDLKITDIDLCVAPLGGLQMTVDVRNRGTARLNGMVRLDLYTKQGGRSRHYTRTVSLDLAPGETERNVVVDFENSFSTANIVVRAVVDEVQSYKSWWTWNGAWIESNENNNTRIREFKWDSNDSCGFVEI